MPRATGNKRERPFRWQVPGSHLYLLCRWNSGCGLNPVFREPVQAFALVLLGKRVNFLTLLTAAPQNQLETGLRQSFPRSPDDLGNLTEMTGAGSGGPESPHETPEKLKRPGCSPQGMRLQGRALGGRPQNLCSAVPTLPGLTVALGNEAGVSPEQSLPKLGRAFEKPDRSWPSLLPQVLGFLSLASYMGQRHNSLHLRKAK